MPSTIELATRQPPDCFGHIPVCLSRQSFDVGDEFQPSGMRRAVQADPGTGMICTGSFSPLGRATPYSIQSIDSEVSR